MAYVIEIESRERDVIDIQSRDREVIEIEVATGGGGGQGDSKAIEQFYLMPTACELEVIEHDNIIAMCEELWLNPTTTDHPAETIKVINVQKNGGIMEEYWSIPDQITIVAMSKTEITTMLDNLWTAIIETSL